MCLEVILPLLFRPPVLFFGSRRDFSGSGTQTAALAFGGFN